MNLQTLVQTAIKAVPAGIRGAATVTRVIAGTYDPETDTRTGDTTEAFTADVILTTPLPDQFSPMPRVEQVREAVLAAADCDFPPAPGCTMQVAGDDTLWTVVAPGPIAPAGTPVLVYRVRVRAIGTVPQA